MPPQGVWSRALGLPIERPKSFTMEALEKKVRRAVATAGVARTRHSVTCTSAPLMGKRIATPAQLLHLHLHHERAVRGCGPSCALRKSAVPPLTFPALRRAGGRAQARRGVSTELRQGARNGVGGGPARGVVQHWAVDGLKATAAAGAAAAALGRTCIGALSSSEGIGHVDCGSHEASCCACLLQAHMWCRWFMRPWLGRTVACCGIGCAACESTFRLPHVATRHARWPHLLAMRLRGALCRASARNDPNHRPPHKPRVIRTARRAARSYLSHMVFSVSTLPNG
jgi:hypothetical protein